MTCLHTKWVILWGGEHNIGDGGGTSAYADYGNGYVSSTFQTIMAIRLTPIPDHRINYFSNPNVSYMGVPTGDVATADVGRVIEERTPIVGAYRVPSSGPLLVNLTGPSAVEGGTQVTVTANPTGGTGSYSYLWYYRQPGGQWINSSVTTQSYVFTHVWPSGIHLRVDVASGNGLTTSAYHSVNYISGAKFDELASVKNSITLDGTYPNPAGDSFEVQYTLDQRGHVNIELFNFLGRKVSGLSADRVEGAHLDKVDVTNLPTGNYLLRISSGDQVVIHNVTVAH